MEYFVRENSVVREIWGKGDTILFIFAGAAAEFAVNKAVDWLYFTGRLPADPLGRLFSTVGYARQIVFSDLQGAYRAIDGIAKAHKGVEAGRGTKIPDWAYRDVLFMLIDYSIRAYELLERKLLVKEKEEVWEVFNRLGKRMEIAGLPETFEEWEHMRLEHMQQNLQESNYTTDLYRQYEKHLGLLRYWLLLDTQAMVVPERVRALLGLGRISLLRPVLSLYKFSRHLQLDKGLKSLLLPPDYKARILALDQPL